ncbi:MAG: HAD-IA family hydrolase [Anaerolineales bacterium]|nr:HAD-IA family hydrolase [Anaerolineales bacterium]
MMLKTPLQGILFDFDGLILDTETTIFQAWQDKFREYGKELHLEDWAVILGKSGSAEGPAEKFLQTIKDEEEKRAIQAEVSRKELELVVKQKPLPGVEELIKKSKHHGLSLGIVSSSDQEWVHTHLKRLDLWKYFDHTSCAEEVQQAKPDPALYQLGLQKMNVVAEKVIVLEDSPNGVLAAKRAGLFCIAVPNSLTRQLPFFPNGGMPDRVLESLQDFPWDELMKDKL